MGIPHLKTETVSPDMLKQYSLCVCFVYLNKFSLSHTHTHTHTFQYVSVFYISALSFGWAVHQHYIRVKTILFIHFLFFFYGATGPNGAGLPYYRGFMITLRHVTLGRTSLDEWSARCRNLYLTTHNTHKRQTSIPPVSFESTIPAVKQCTEWHALDRAATGIGSVDTIDFYKCFFFFFYWHYNPLWVLAFSVIFFHSALSSHCFLYSLTPIICKSSSMPAIHLFLGLPLVLIPIGFYCNILLGVLLSSICVMWPSQAILLLFINLTISAFPSRLVHSYSDSLGSILILHWAIDFINAGLWKCL
jgi:hypothetical protein